ncbi:MAG: hypothetical protein OEV08_15455 [Nitrospira sp.]|nr:hypothetical protein [Nitrospira sp.]
MKLKKIAYSKLNSRQKEIFNFQKVAGLLADYSFHCMKLADDWQDADFLAYHKNGSHTLPVQLESRLKIELPNNWRYLTRGADPPTVSRLNNTKVLCS